MKNFLWLVLPALAGIGLFGAGASAQVGPDGDLTYQVSSRLFGGQALPGEPDLLYRNRYEGEWLTATADLLVMDRVGPRSVPLVRNATTGAELLNAKDLDFKWELGPRVNFIAHRVLFDQDIEASYFGIDGFRASETVYSASNPIAFSIPGYTYTAANGAGIRFEYPSQIYSAELNGRIYLYDRLSLLAGFRWVNLHENLVGTGIVGGMGTEFLDINVDNHLYGGQIGMDVSLLDFDGPFRIDGVLKAGVFGNYTDQAAIVGGRNYGDKRDHTAFLGEINLVAVYEITPNILLRGGYQVLWLEGVALAGDQPATLDLNSNDFQPDTRGSLFYHGAFAGLEINY
ncbi:MAG: hypothetical protein JXB10_15545 [Pirellulales bacterium]|nr:hypothetical protein [Pirellulales bacterium]